MNTEKHPLPPFLPYKACLLMLGSFPPQKKRWSMDFYYPNWNNDMWRIMGLLFYKDKNHFVNRQDKTFCLPKIISFLQEKGIALYDTASEIRRLQDNASDKYLEVVTPTDIASLLDKLPHCQAVATTGQKATELFCSQFKTIAPPMGSYVPFFFGQRFMRLYRLPSSSRAYPLTLEKKASIYSQMCQELHL